MTGIDAVGDVVVRSPLELTGQISTVSPANPVFCGNSSALPASSNPLLITSRAPTANALPWVISEREPKLVSSDPLEPGGLGLRLVDELATEWGTRANGTRCVWFCVSQAA